MNDSTQDTADSHRAYDIYCRKCRYSLLGQKNRRCPECGTPFDPAADHTFFLSPSEPVRQAARTSARLAGTIVIVVVAIIGFFTAACGGMFFLQIWLD